MALFPHPSPVDSFPVDKSWKRHTEEGLGRPTGGETHEVSLPESQKCQEFFLELLPAYIMIRTRYLCRGNLKRWRSLIRLSQVSPLLRLKVKILGRSGDGAVGSYFLLGVSRQLLTSPYVCWKVPCMEQTVLVNTSRSHFWGVIVVGKHVLCLIIPLKMILAEAFLLKIVL